MPVVYVHGVATRDREQPFAQIETLLRRYVTPVINQANTNRVDSYEHTKANSGALMAAAGAAVVQTLKKHAEDEAAKGKKDAAE